MGAPAREASFCVVEQFARDHADVVSVVGIGSYDTAAQALDFRKRHALTTVRAIYDADAKSRRALKVLSQPSGVLVAANGKILARYTGEIDFNDVLAKV